KYVLVDFWASWCVPCRVENRLYNQLLPKYADHPFAIFAVNLDDSRQIWEMASKKDRVVWPQISDSLGWQSPLAAAYNVTALPMSFLMDPDGRIIGRNLRGEALEAKLAELLE
ncbi:MAG: TlpA disulfide reductase family protein, partial [Verrucomicrobiota bacterium]|nr:TlpA disulfide reductase family protein [Verrucomicrobiota bacterium]